MKTYVITYMQDGNPEFETHTELSAEASLRTFAKEAGVFELLEDDCNSFDEVVRRLQNHFNDRGWPNDDPFLELLRREL